ncbi:ABC transporter ATP-binding protein [Spirosoma oryzicola]|uniref:ATP-binding cassette domain-containing protein n=1 Tax=Spirosoma oryzicola TaxID=2898794 RepID=UPI001E436CC7|nr:ABC transporter ATP-binding protein [Spirosoma oryzicola]UHG91748.1 ABC transporter ATP-binding protein [Spirosoma oryzicola]
MITFNIVRKSKPPKSFRVASVMGTFDLQSDTIEERFTGYVDPPENWQVGLIVGASGTGKTTIAKHLFPDSYITNFAYNKPSILDDMPAGCTCSDITSMFNAVGFSSPPSWLKPYDVLSNGEKMRVDLANALLRDEQLIVFDEFTSVVDRTVAQIGSYAVQKAIRRSTKQFIAVTCHYDVEQYLKPDWVFDTNTMTFRVQEVTEPGKPEPGTPPASSISTYMLVKGHYVNVSYGRLLASITI